MMADPASLVAVTLGATFGIAIFSAAALKGWQGWLELKRWELQQRAGRHDIVRGRGDVGDLRERVKKLEAIASGEI